MPPSRQPNPEAARDAGMNITTISLNGTSGQAKVLKPWVQALNNPALVTEKAGFIFKLGLADAHLMLAVEPCLIQGERRYHYNLHLPDDNAITISGNVDANGVFILVPKAKSMKLTNEEKHQFANICQTFAALLVAQGYTGAGQLDEVTQCVLMELDLSPPPATLHELANNPF